MKTRDRVICKVLDASHLRTEWKSIFKDTILTVRSTFTCPQSKLPGVLFEEITNSFTGPNGTELGYLIWDFEVLVSDSELEKYRNEVSVKELTKITKLQPLEMPKELELA